MRTSHKNLAAQYIRATEWNLATLSGYALRKSTPKYEVKRQIDICAKMTSQCYDIMKDFEDDGGVKETLAQCTRVRDILLMDTDFSLAVQNWFEKEK